MSKNTVNNVSDYDTRLIIWALARQNRLILACKVAYESLLMDLSTAREYVRYLSGCDNFPLDDELSKELHNKNYPSI